MVDPVRYAWLWLNRTEFPEHLLGIPASMRGWHKKTQPY